MKTIKESTNPRSLTVRPDLDGPDQYFLNNRPVAEYRTDDNKGYVFGSLKDQFMDSDMFELSGDALSFSGTQEEFDNLLTNNGYTVRKPAKESETIQGVFFNRLLPGEMPQFKGSPGSRDEVGVGAKIGWRKGNQKYAARFNPDLDAEDGGEDTFTLDLLTLNDDNEVVDLVDALGGIDGRDLAYVNGHLADMWKPFSGSTQTESGAHAVFKNFARQKEITGDNAFFAKTEAESTHIVSIEIPASRTKSYKSQIKFKKGKVLEPFGNLPGQSMEKISSMNADLTTMVSGRNQQEPYNPNTILSWVRAVLPNAKVTMYTSEAEKPTDTYMLDIETKWPGGGTHSSFVQFKKRKVVEPFSMSFSGKSREDLNAKLQDLVMSPDYSPQAILDWAKAYIPGSQFKLYNTTELNRNRPKPSAELKALAVELSKQFGFPKMFHDQEGGMMVYSRNGLDYWPDMTKHGWELIDQSEEDSYKTYAKGNLRIQADHESFTVYEEKPQSSVESQIEAVAKALESGDNEPFYQRLMSMVSGLTRDQAAHYMSTAQERLDQAEDEDGYSDEDVLAVAAELAMDDLQESSLPSDLAKQGIFSWPKGTPLKVGSYVDFYSKDGNKLYGVVTAYDGKTISIRDVSGGNRNQGPVTKMKVQLETNIEDAGPALLKSQILDLEVAQSTSPTPQRAEKIAKLKQQLDQMTAKKESGKYAGIFLLFGSGAGDSYGCCLVKANSYSQALQIAEEEKWPGVLSPWKEESMMLDKSIEEGYGEENEELTQAVAKLTGDTKLVSLEWFE